MIFLTRTVFVFFLLVFGAQADNLSIKVHNNEMSLPYWPARDVHYGAVLIVHGGDVPQWSKLLTNLAEQLAHYGWSVVLINCTNDNSIPWIAQLPKVISALRQEKNKRIILVHYGDQINKSLEYFSKPQSKMINGMVMVSAYDGQKVLDIPLRLRFPVFDIVGQFDFNQVLYQVNLRGKEFNRHNYLSIELPGAHHDYEYSQKLLLAYVHGWMAKLPESEIHAPPILVSYIEPILFLPSYIASIYEESLIQLL